MKVFFMVMDEAHRGFLDEVSRLVRHYSTSRYSPHPATSQPKGTPEWAPVHTEDSALFARHPARIAPTTPSAAEASMLPEGKSLSAELGLAVSEQERTRYLAWTSQVGTPQTKNREYPQVVVRAAKLEAGAIARPSSIQSLPTNSLNFSSPQNKLSQNSAQR